MAFYTIYQELTNHMNHMKHLLTSNPSPTGSKDRRTAWSELLSEYNDAKEILDTYPRFSTRENKDIMKTVADYIENTQRKISKPSPPIRLPTTALTSRAGKASGKKKSPKRVSKASTRKKSTKRSPPKRPATATEASLQLKTVAELKLMARLLGVPVSGKKADLIARIESHKTKAVQIRKDVETMTVAELKEELKALGAKPKGARTKAQLIIRLKEVYLEPAL